MQTPEEASAAEGGGARAKTRTGPSATVAAGHGAFDRVVREKDLLDLRVIQLQEELEHVQEGRCFLYVHVFVCVFVCVYVYACVRACARACM